jgi:2-phosphoglycerate kinase
VENQKPHSTFLLPQPSFSVRVENVKQPLQIKRGKESYAFSVGIIVESLQGAGVPTEVAIALARDLEKHYKKEKNKTVKLEQLVERLAKGIDDVSGKKMAERFRSQTPPFVPIQLQQGDKVTAFSRRTLATQLEKLDLSFKEAFGVAGQVEQTLRNKGYELVSERELTHVTALALEASFGRELRSLFEMQRGQPLDILVREPTGESFPFSRGILAQSLMAVGLEPELAYSLAKDFEDDLWHEGLLEVTRDNLREKVRKSLEETSGKDVARRYEMMKAVRQADKPIIILIGGAPGVGKSTLAAELAYRLGIRRLVSSDAVREALRSLIPPQLSPELHASSYTAWRVELLPDEDDKPKRKRVIRGYQAQSQQLAAALSAVVKRNVVEATSVVIEGVHLLPGLLPVISTTDATLVHLILAASNEDAHRRYFELRDKQTGQRRDGKGYLDHFEEIRIIHDFILERAQVEKVTVITTGDFNETIEQGLEYVLEKALLQRGTTKRTARPTQQNKQKSRQK